MPRLKKILCPVDFFKTSSRAFDYALKLAEHYKSKIHAIHVIAPLIGAAYGTSFSVEDMTQDLKKDADGLAKAGEGLSEACGACHKKFWYPKDKQ